MPSQMSPSSAACTHDLGPGITVCLRCRQERRDAIRAHQQRLFAMSGVAAMALLGVYVMGASAANAYRASSLSNSVQVAPRASVIASSVSQGSEVKQQGIPTGAPTGVPTVAPNLESPASASPAAWQPPLVFVVREGRTDLPESLVAERGADSVIVDFDTPATRTRRRDKFEAVVRRTLPMVYGTRADSVLRAIPEGGMLGDADLLTELPTRGLHLRVAQGWTLDLWPETRLGQDGPLVVSYRARVTRDGALR